jgi:DNA mismatch repair ATPase MutS
MNIDRHTLRDLEIFDSGSGRSGVFQVIDSTRTTVGSSVLKYWLEHPLSEPHAIMQRQEAQTYIAHSRVPFFTTPRDLLSALAYLDSNIQRPAASRTWRDGPRAIWLAVRYRTVYREIKNGVSATASLLRQADGFLARIGAEEAPATFRSDLLEVREQLGEAEMRRAMSPGAAGPFTTYRRDRIFRSTRVAAVRRVVDLAGQVDALLAAHEMSARLGFQYPKPVSDSGFRLRAQGLFHPFLPDAVRNDAELSHCDRVLFLTGPNMAGKTTYLKTVGIVLLLAQAGLPVPARRLSFTPVDFLITGIRTEDNLRRGLSYFMAEVVRVRVAAEVLATGARALVLFDEIFKGTNVRDALEASESVIRGFAKSQCSGFIFASHLTELAAALEGAPGLRFGRFEPPPSDDPRRFPYELAEGVSDQRFGLQLLEREGVPDLLGRIGRIPPEGDGATEQQEEP